MNGYAPPTLPKQTRGLDPSRMHFISKRPAGEKVSDKQRKEFLEAARQYFFGSEPAGTGAAGT